MFDYFECDCLRLILPLDEDEELPDHVCLETCRIACDYWVSLNSGFSAGNLNLIKLADGRAVLARKRGPGKKWPLEILHSDSHVILTFSQWIEEKSADEQQGFALIKKLDDNIRWKRVKKILETKISTYDPSLENSEFQDWVEISAMIILNKNGFPYTKNTIRYLVSEVTSKISYNGYVRPTRGLLLSNIAISFPPNEKVPIGNGELLQTLIGNSPWTTNDLWERGTELTKIHAEWWEKIPWSLFNRNEGLLPSGRPKVNDELSKDVNDHINGRLSRSEVVKREMERQKVAMGQERYFKEYSEVNRTIEDKIRKRIQRAGIKKNL